MPKNAKKAGSADPEVQDRRDKGQSIVPAPAYIDFHLVTGASSHDLATVREEDYRVNNSHRRTMRPYRRERLELLQEAVCGLQSGKARLPRSKQQDLLESALEPRPEKARRLVKEVYSRCEPEQRHGLLKALQGLQPVNAFPWSALDLSGTKYATGLVDLMEAVDLFPLEP